LAKGLVDKAIIAESTGLTGIGCFGSIAALLDSGHSSGDHDIFRAAEVVRQAGFTVVEDENAAEFGSPPAPARCDGAGFYTRRLAPGSRC
jgi:hypothetical protein